MSCLCGGAALRPALRFRRNQLPAAAPAAAAAARAAVLRRGVTSQGIKLALDAVKLAETTHGAVKRQGAGAAAAAGAAGSRLLQRVIGAVAGLGVVGTLAAAVSFFDLWDRFTAKPIDEQAARAVIKSAAVLTTPSTELVDRPASTAAIAEYVASTGGATYLVVVGPRGCGKSTAVQAAVAGRKGVVTVTVSGGSGNGVFPAIAESIGVKGFDAHNENQLVPVLRKAVAMRARECESGESGKLPSGLQLQLPWPRGCEDSSWRPTLVVEVDRSGDDGVVAAAAYALKRLCSDRRGANVVLVLGDDADVFALPPDPARQDVVWVDDFSVDEATEYLDKRGFLTTSVRDDDNDVTDNYDAAARRETLFREVGTRVAVLSKAVSKGEAGLEAFVAAQQGQAEEDVCCLTTYGDPAVDRAQGKHFERLVRDLLRTHASHHAGGGGGNGGSGGSGSAEAPGVAAAATSAYLAPPSVASRALERYRAVVYHQPTRTYRFASPAHRRAAERRFGPSGTGAGAWLGAG